MVEGGSAADPGIPDTRMVELKHGGIEYDGEWSLTHQHGLDHRLILEQKHESAGMEISNSLTWGTATQETTFSPGTKSFVFNLFPQLCVLLQYSGGGPQRVVL